MLIEFSVENYRSFKDKATLSLLASSDKSLESNLIASKELGEHRALRSAVIYGANASGKTNLLFAIDFLRNMVLRSHQHQRGQKLNFTPFRLDKACLSKPSRFGVVFTNRGIKYQYSIALDAERIIEENLYSFPKGRRALVFSRRNTTDYVFTRDKKKQKFISDSTLDNMLYLSSSTQHRYEETAPAFDWFKDVLRTVIGTDNPEVLYFTIRLLNKSGKMKEAVLRALTYADTGIDNVMAETRRVSVDELYRVVPPELRRVLLDSYKPESGPIEEFKVTTTHKVIGKDGKETKAEFAWNEESEGTRRFFVLMGIWLDALQNGRVLIVDEIDVKLHVMLNDFLVRIFHDPTQNSSNAQLVVATHNTNLLDQNLFRRDQIWFLERNPYTGSSTVYSLLEFSPRKDKNLQKGYLAGRYGAIPFVQDQKVFT